MIESPASIVGSGMIVLAPHGCVGATPSRFYPPLGSNVSDADGVVMYYSTAVTPPTVPTSFWVGGWWFPTWHIPGGGGPGGWMDANGGWYGNFVRMPVIGGGTATIYVTGGWFPGGGRQTWVEVSVIHRVGSVGVVDWSSGLVSTMADTAIVVPVPGNASGFCSHWIDFAWTSTFAAGGGFAGFDWVSEEDAGPSNPLRLRGSGSYLAP